MRKKESLEEKVFKTIKRNKLIEKDEKIIVGVSGGPDSLSLLKILYDIKNNISKYGLTYKIIVAHINHQIRKEANEEEKFVKEICKKYNIEFYSKRIDIKKVANNNKIGTEEAGRKIRYEFFEQIGIKTNAQKIAIAHNKNDNVETIIMNALRGASISGLKGIQPSNGKIIRPLIECSRDEIEEFCREFNLNPKIDKTNFENIYTRNKIRNIVIPYIKKEFNSNIIETLNRLSYTVRKEDSFIEKIVIEEFNKLKIEEEEKKITLDLKKFNELHEVIKARLLLYTITKVLGTSQGIYQIHIEDMIKLCSKNIGNKYLTPNKNIKIFIKKQKIHITAQN